ncbi:MAG: cytochrome b N-terminal domain-containing protein [Acidobacteriota bacterium]|nr:cytochrome b N-terminal domain-containing protein [Acidobacteriota bacterium]
MPEEIKPVEQSKEPVGLALKKMNAPSRFFRWIDQRTGVHEILNESLDEPIPGGARLAYVFGSGLLYIFISQIITGLCLALYYVPSADSAHTSVAYIMKEVAAGSFLRSLHSYGSSAMIIVLALHFLQTFLYGSFKGRRELLWISGAVLSLLVLGMGFTGYLLPWDQKSYFATAVGTNIVGQIPLIGNWLTRLLRGGDTIGTLTLSRFYIAHVFLIPACIMGFIGVHLLLFRKAGPAGPIEEDPVNPKLPPQGFYPRQVLMDMTFALLIMVGLGALAYLHPAQLGPIANPANTEFIARPDWYYLPFFEWLKFFEGPTVVLAVVVVPGILALLFFLMPFLDRSLERRPWRRPIPVLSVAIVLAGILFLGVRSRVDDQRDASVRAQLAVQEQQEKAYSEAPFKPFQESPGGGALAGVATGPPNPLVAQGRSIFAAHGCAGCHGAAGVGGIAPTLVGIAAKLPGGQLSNLLQHPNAAMNAGHMPPVDVSAPELTALTAYLGALGSPTAEAPAGSPAESPAAAPSAAVAGVAEPASKAQSGALPSTIVKTVAGQTAPASTASGEHLFEQRGCAACHGAAGVGGRVAAMPTLIAGQPNAHVLQLIAVPDAKMKAGGMQPVTGSPAELTSVVAYLRTLGSASLAKPPAAVSADAKPVAPVQPTTTAAVPATAVASATAPSPTAPTPSASAAVAVKSNAGHAVFISQGCAACHGANGGGTHFAPALVGISAKFPGAALPNLLHHPNAKMKAGGMPPVTANPAQVSQLVSYITSLDLAPVPVSASAASSGTAGAGQPMPVNTAAPKAVNANPAQETATVIAPPSPLAVHGGQVFQHFSCETCHGAGGLHGTAAAPGLAGTASMLPAATLNNLLRHHSTQMINGNMPPTNMNAQDLKALIAYIRAMPSGPETP